MSGQNGQNGVHVPAASAPPDVNSAKAQLQAWAETHDAKKIAARSDTGTIVAVGALAMVGGLVAARILTPHGYKSASASSRASGASTAGWVLAWKAGKWLLPVALSALKKSSNGHSVASTSSDSV